ncbi:large ribosomal subunit protein eL18-like [Convolutriloba macropyga]|uniref:large ribosomal subunit protein eL18-like n=1 Tax=Convolutriloba macropyga TaxID=536237 RepID=UPI003F5262E4
MGIDLDHRFDRKAKRTDPKSDDNYLRLLVQLYKFLSRRTQSKFNRIVLKRMCMARRFRPAMSLKRMVRIMLRTRVSTAGKDAKTVSAIQHGLTAVVVGSVTDDIRRYMIPKGLKVCALHVSAPARKRILEAGGEIITFDVLAQQSPKGEKTVLMQGHRNAREAQKHFGPAPGTPGSHTKPYVKSKGRKFERARGRRASRGYKN